MGALSDTRREYLFDTPPEEVAQEPGARPGVDPAMSCPNGGRRLQTAARKTKTRPREEMSGPKTMKRQWEQCQPVAESGPAGARGVPHTWPPRRKEREGPTWMVRLGSVVRTIWRVGSRAIPARNLGLSPPSLVLLPWVWRTACLGPKGILECFQAELWRELLAGAPRAQMQSWKEQGWPVVSFLLVPRLPGPSNLIQAQTPPKPPCPSPLPWR